MWEVLFVSANADVIEELKKSLTLKQIISRIRCLDKETGSPVFEVLVPHAEFDQAQEIMLDLEK